MNRIARTLGVVGCGALGVLIYALCIDMFGGYPQVHSAWLTRVAIALLIAVSVVIWVWHGRVGDDDGHVGDDDDRD